VFKSFFYSYELKNNASVDFASGLFAGTMSKIATLPLDIVRKRLQIQGPYRHQQLIENVPKYSNGWMNTMIRIQRHEGFLALFKGTSVSVLKSGVSSGVTFLIVSKGRRFLIEYELV
jgi:solute carrier family 25 thiamine pyrophosphate transporter 19